MERHITTLLKAEEGATALEYGLIAALIAGLIVTAVTALGLQVQTIFDSIANTISGAGGGS